MLDDLPAVPVIQRALRKFRLIFDTWYPWDQKRLLARLRPMTLRILADDDMDWCEKLYIRNEHFGLPEFGREEYSQYLRSRDHLILIAEDATGRIGTYGMHRIDDSSAAYLCYVMVDPGIRQSGIGTTMLITAIALLGTGISEQNLVLTALDTSLPFYQKLGYVPFHAEMVKRHQLTYAALGPITIPLVIDCREMLEAADVTLPRLTRPIPISKSPLPTDAAMR